uniref:Uncharacterized protein n=1 Tax=Amphimedon queenslandica TaxID=400682 RepID=A0A1X7U0U5_AMPQE
MFQANTMSFSKFSVRNYREKFYEDHFHYTKPLPICMGEEWEWVSRNGEKSLQKIYQHANYIDIFDTLKALYGNPAVREQLEYSHQATDGIKRDFCDGEYFKTHPVFSRHENAIQFILYFDEIEVANPLGSKAGNHKLGCFYYTIGNIQPVHRSSLPSMFLLAVAKSENIEAFRCDANLKQFVSQINKLLEGVELKIDEQHTYKVYGAVIAMAGDTPASNFIGGFKEGFHAQSFIFRTLKAHHDELLLIKEGSSKFSVMYGINKRSELLDMPGFDITKCLPYV